MSGGSGEVDARQAADDDKNTIIDALAVMWKFPTGAITVFATAIGLPALSARPKLVAMIGLAMAAIGLLIMLAALAQRSKHKPARFWGVLMGAFCLLPIGAFLAGLIPGFPTPTQVSQGLGIIEEPVQRPPLTPWATPELPLTLTIQAENQAETFAELLRRRIPEAVPVRAAAARPGARTVAVAATASGRWADAAARLYIGRLDVRMQVAGAESPCELHLESAGRQTVDVAATQIADQLAPRIAAFMQGNEQC